MSDQLAYEPLIAVMAAAGRHDEVACLRLLDDVEAHLGPAFHKARADVEAARAHATAGRWPLVWGAAHQALCGLTWAFPPDLSACPPVPAATPFTDEVGACGCGADLASHCRFCPRCGSPAVS